MTAVGWLQITLFAVIIGLLTRPLGGYLTRVYAGEKTFLHLALGPIEGVVYRLAGVKPGAEQSWLHMQFRFCSFTHSQSSRSMRFFGCNRLYRSIRRACRASSLIWL